MKSGTTWLWGCLRQNPDVWTPQRKELHYFDHVPHRWDQQLLPWRKPFPDRRHELRLLQNARDLRHFAGALGWLFRYWMLPRGDRWYAGIFRGHPEKLCGEVTPAYAILGEDQVAHVRRLYPDLRLILLLRDPIERSWSQARMRLSEADLADDEVCLRILRSDSVVRRSDYVRTLDTWRRHFPANQLFIGYYDELKRRPAWLLEPVCDFLGLVFEGSWKDRPLQMHRNKGRSVPLRPRLARELARLHLPMLEVLSRRLRGPTEAWRDRARRLVEET